MPGYLDTECLLAELLEQDRQVLWLRLEPDDGDPATFLLSLLQAIQTQKPDLGTELIEKMRRSPGPVSGWPPLFQHMAQTLAEALGENGALVFEHVHKLSPLQPTLSLVSAYLVPNLPDHNACIMIHTSACQPLHFQATTTRSPKKTCSLLPGLASALPKNWSCAYLKR